MANFFMAWLLCSAIALAAAASIHWMQPLPEEFPNRRTSRRLPTGALQPVDEPLGELHPDLVLLAAALAAVLEVGIVVDLDDVDAVRRLLQVDAIQSVADAARRAHGDVDDVLRRLLQ